MRPNNPIDATAVVLLPYLITMDSDQDVVWSVIDMAFSSAVIVPGQTTCDDVISLHSLITLRLSVLRRSGFSTQ